MNKRTRRPTEAGGSDFRLGAMVFFQTNWGDLCSLAGLLIAISLIYRTKRVAEAARDAANEIKRRFLENMLARDIGVALRRMKATLVLQQASEPDWRCVQDKYLRLGKALAAIGSRKQFLTESQQVRLQNVIVQVRTNQRNVWGYLGNTVNKLDSGRLNQILSAQFQDLSQLAEELGQRL